VPKPRGRPATGHKPNVSIRLDPDVLQQAKTAATLTKKYLGEWLESAIQEKIQREAREINDEDVA